MGSPGARVVASRRVLDLDHVCSEVGQQHGCVRSSQDARKVDDANVLQRRRHAGADRCAGRRPRPRWGACREGAQGTGQHRVVVKGQRGDLSAGQVRSSTRVLFGPTRRWLLRVKGLACQSFTRGVLSNPSVTSSSSREILHARRSRDLEAVAFVGSAVAVAPSLTASPGSCSRSPSPAFLVAQSFQFLHFTVLSLTSRGSSSPTRIEDFAWSHDRESCGGQQRHISSRKTCRREVTRSIMFLTYSLLPSVPRRKILTPRWASETPAVAVHDTPARRWHSCTSPDR